MAMTSQPPLMVSDISPSVSQSAAQAQLGDQPVAAFHVRVTGQVLAAGIFCLLIGLGLIAGGVAIYAIIPYPDAVGTGTLIVMGILGLLCVAGALYNFFYGVIHQNWHVYVYKHGFIYTRGQVPQVFRWDQVETIWFQVTRNSYNGIYTGTTHWYRVRRQDGVEVILNNRFARIADLGEMVNEQITQSKLPQVVAAYNAGYPIAFGSLNISQQGISNAYGMMLPWWEIKGISIQRGFIAFNQAGKWHKWSLQSVSKLPNALLFIYLTRVILKQNASSAAKQR
jgi:hypothetical protein